VEKLMRRLGSPHVGRVETKGFGKDWPLVPGSDEASRRINRRGEILFEVPAEF
jgi:outer membrane protein OmpA-like peptidoglycan-associated protein